MKSAANTWTEPGYPAAIEFSPEALEGLRERSLTGLRGVPKVGVGGLLLGTRDGATGVLRVGAILDLPCAHIGGPSFNLTPEELAHAVSLVRAPRELSVVGWYLSRTQPPLAPRAADLNLYSRLCPAAWQIMAMVRPGYVDETKVVVFFRDSSGEVVAGAIRDVPEQQKAGGRAESSPVSGANQPPDPSHGQRGDLAPRRPVSGAAAGNTSQPAGAHGFESVRSFRLVPEKPPGTVPDKEAEHPVAAPTAAGVAKKSVFQQNPFAVSATPAATEPPADAKRAKQPVSGASAKAGRPALAPGAAGVAKKSVFEQNPFAVPSTPAVPAPPADSPRGKQPVSGTSAEAGTSVPTAGPPAAAKKSVFEQLPFAVRSTPLVPEPPADAPRSKQPVSGAAAEAGRPAAAPVAPAVAKKSIFQRNPFAVPATPAVTEPLADAKRGKQPALGAPAEAGTSAAAPVAPAVAKKSIFQQNPFAVPATPAVTEPLADAKRGKQPASGAPAEAGTLVPTAGPPAAAKKSVFEQLPFAVHSTPVVPEPPADAQRSKEPASEASARAGASIPVPVLSPAQLPEGPSGFEAVAANSLPKSNPSVSRPAEGNEGPATPVGTPTHPAPETDPPRGAHGFEAFHPHKLVRANQPVPAAGGDAGNPEPPSAARVIASRTPAESAAPVAPRRNWLVIGAVAAAVLSVVAWATTSLWLGAPLRLELSEAGGHITAIWNTDGVARGVAGTLVVTDSGKTVTIALSPEKVITGVAGFNPKTGNISATLKIGGLEAQAQWRAPDNWAPPEPVDPKPADDPKPASDPGSAGNPNPAGDPKPKP